MVLLLLNNLYQQTLPAINHLKPQTPFKNTFKIRHENKDTFSETVSNKFTLKVYQKLLKANYVKILVLHCMPSVDY